MKKLIVLGICAAMAVSIAACGSQDQPSASTAAPTETSVQMQIPNPFVPCETLEDAEQLAGFSLSLPETLPDWVTETAIQATQTGMIEIVYRGADNELRIRKATGTEDISGDYSDYETAEEVSVGNLKVQMRGSGDKYSLAFWNDGTYSFSVSVTDGIEPEDMNTLISFIG